MLLSFAFENEKLILNIDGVERRDLDTPDGLLTQDELDQIRAIRPNALPGYPVKDEDEEVARGQPDINE